MRGGCRRLLAVVTSSDLKYEGKSRYCHSLLKNGRGPNSKILFTYKKIYAKQSLIFFINITN